jgi:hypothetical protein
VNLHRLAEARSIALHRAIADRMQTDGRVLAAARERVAEWIRAGTPDPYYADAWNEVLSRSIDEIRAFLVEPGERACTLRQVSPFAGEVSPRERWKMWREVRAAYEAEHE